MLVSITEVSFAGKKRYLSFLNDNHALLYSLIDFLPNLCIFHELTLQISVHTA